ncbi:MAG: S41 family peptidase [Candidatus Sulfotelmatobacter sp.]
MLQRVTFASVILMVLVSVTDCPSQQGTLPSKKSTPGISNADRERALGILDGVSRGIQSLYYDPKMNGIDWNAVLARARVKISGSDSLNDALTQIAIAVSELNDSHTNFEPPARPYGLDFGFDYQIFWSACLVSRVRPGSDAEAKGLKPGQQILSINGTLPNRLNLHSIEYLDYVLNPRPEMLVEIDSPLAGKKKVTVTAKMTMSSDLAYRPGAGVRYDVIRSSQNVQHRMRMQWVQIGDIYILRMPWFFYDAEDFYELGKKIRKGRGLIVDLRGNPGGAVETLKYFTGMFYDHDVKLCDRVGRKKTQAEIAKSEHAIYFPGKLVVLVDSESASAAEIFARVVQLEKRGKVIGDKTSGSVMEATGYYFASSGIDYGAEVTIANVVMSDGKSLEHRGVMPDEIALPQSDDLGTGRDPVLAQAAQELGVIVSPENAGKLFPYEWPKD